MSLDPVHLKAIIQLEPEAAINYLKSKGFQISWNWHEVLDGVHARQFTVAKCARLDVLKDIFNGLSDGLQFGTTEKQFIDRMKPILQSKGWWGKQVIVDSQGNAEMAQLGSPRRLATIYQTNLQSAYMAGRYQQMMASSADRPYWQYIAVLDGRTRASHRAMNGKVFRFDDPIWQTHFPPNGFNCRCRVRSLTEENLKDWGLKVESSAGRLFTIDKDLPVDPRTGDIGTTTVTGIKVTGSDGKLYTFAPDTGFNSSPAASHILDDLLYQKALSVLPNRASALQEVQDTLLSPVRLKAWEGFVDTALNSAYATNRTMAIGVLSDVDLNYVAAKGLTPESAVIFVEDRMLVGPKALRHQKVGNALTRDEWLALPNDLTQAQVLWDTKNKTLLYVFPSQDGRKSKLAVKLDSLTRKGKSERGNGAVTVFKVEAIALEAAIKGAEYLIVR
jgi:SPP1 gp7 family putative phage head morphogenesis protein